MLDNIDIVEPKQVLPHVHALVDGNWRFVTVTCCKNPDDTFDLFYSFDKDYVLRTVKTTVQPGETVQSVSGACLAASFAENEISELFGVPIEGLRIDYGGHFILADGAPQSPFGPGVIIEKKDGGANA